MPVGGAATVVPGSAVIAAHADGFDSYHFVEPQRRPAAALHQRIAALRPNNDYEVHSMPRAEAVREIVARMRQSSRSPHYLCFVDPEGFTEITLPDLAPLFALPRGDFFFNFQHTGVKRAIPAAVSFLGRPELAGRLPDLSHDDIVRVFGETLASRGRPRTLWIPIEHGDNPYAYGMMYAAAQTYGGNRWLENFEQAVAQRMRGIDGQRLANILGGERSLDSLPKKDPQRKLF